MHYSRVLASVALVAVACAAPVADSSSSTSSASPTSKSSSHRAYATPVVRAYAAPAVSASSRAYYPVVTPGGKSGYVSPPLATGVPVPVYYGTTEGGDSTYDFAIDEPEHSPFEDVTTEWEVPAFEKFSDEAYAVQAEGDDTEEATAIPVKGAYAVDEEGEKIADAEHSYDIASGEPTTEVEEGKPLEASSDEAADSFDGDSSLPTAEEPKYHPKNGGYSYETGPARKHCK